MAEGAGDWGEGKLSTREAPLQMPRRKPLAKSFAIFSKEGNLEFRGGNVFLSAWR